ncbi:dynein axonemal assembly factor 19 [Gadus morhua]|uniref:dynein axonemal assembly factor 19 n=1 Tax=Gadus morhua TaxID=8049 RepID=UPI0011B7BF19|nr:coiled-coil domain-containing protein 103 [Gadus morhua]
MSRCPVGEVQEVQEDVQEELIDFRSLDRELLAAVREDQKGRRENAAKLRATSQRLATYEEFRDIVLACHLKPLDQKEKRGTGRQTWNPWCPLATTPHPSPSNHPSSPPVP